MFSFFFFIFSLLQKNCSLCWILQPVIYWRPLTLLLLRNWLKGKKRGRGRVKREGVWKRRYQYRYSISVCTGSRRRWKLLFTCKYFVFLLLLFCWLLCVCRKEWRQTKSAEQKEKIACFTRKPSKTVVFIIQRPSSLLLQMSFFCLTLRRSISRLI